MQVSSTPSSNYYATSSSTAGTGGGRGDRRHPPFSKRRSPSSASLPSNARLTATQQTFPRRLHNLLDNATKEGLDHIISWKPNGYQFNIHDRKKFVDLILPRYFNGIKKHTSFVKQLNRYSFRRIASGIDRGAYHHPCMLRGKPDLCDYVTRIPEITRGETSSDVVYHNNSTVPKKVDAPITHRAGNHNLPSLRSGPSRIADNFQASYSDTTSPSSVPSSLKKNDAHSVYHHHPNHHKKEQHSSVSLLFGDINAANTANEEEDIEPTSLEELRLRAERNLARSQCNSTRMTTTIQMPSEDITDEIITTFLHPLRHDV